MSIVGATIVPALRDYASDHFDSMQRSFGMLLLCSRLLATILLSTTSVESYAIRSVSVRALLIACWRRRYVPCYLNGMIALFS
ncbi:MAG: hypothetical protein GPOALKHO_001114 [Sodalis sp.]|nr:MAG: hypothetical protein GPOALKHO_001114 [Sodalis sp.]